MAKDLRQIALERLTTNAGLALEGMLSNPSNGRPLGYMLMVFDMGGEGDGFTAYISNAHREDVAKLLRLQADHLEAQIKPEEASS